MEAEAAQGGAVQEAADESTELSPTHVSGDRNKSVE